MKCSKASAIALTALPRSPLKTALFAARVVARHFARVDAGRRRLPGCREVDGDDAQAELFEALADEQQLAALGVEGAGDVGRTAAAGSDREVVDRCTARAGFACGGRGCGRCG
jgi:hypothetical protein